MTKNTFLIAALIFIASNFGLSQDYNFEPSADHPFGLPNPEAPPQILDYAPLIGECNCKSVSRNADQTWAEPLDMIWRFKYIMNGMGIQDETLKADGKNSGSIRQFIADSSRWYVHYYSSGAPSTTLPAWEGNKNKEGNMVLYRDQKAPNGMDGFYKITFSEMDGNGFKWLGEWVTKDESFSFPTWKIDCTKISYAKNEMAHEKILSNTKDFSQAFIDARYDKMAEAYTTDGKIFPGNSKIIEGREAIKKYWERNEGSKTLKHLVTPSEIKFLGDYAYDYGYYEGKTQGKDGTISDWGGKYVIVWKKVNNDWKIHLDIWNR